jgi:hypothetical protein
VAVPIEGLFEDGLAGASGMIWAVPVDWVGGADDLLSPPIPSELQPVSKARKDAETMRRETLPSTIFHPLYKRLLEAHVFFAGPFTIVGDGLYQRRKQKSIGSAPF